MSQLLRAPGSPEKIVTAPRGITPSISHSTGGAGTSQPPQRIGNVFAAGVVASGVLSKGGAVDAAGVAVYLETAAPNLSFSSSVDGNGTGSPRALQKASTLSQAT